MTDKPDITNCINEAIEALHFVAYGMQSGMINDLTLFNAKTCELYTVREMVDGSYKKLKALRDAAPDLSDFARYYQNKDFGSPVYQAAYLLYKAAHKEGE